MTSANETNSYLECVKNALDVLFVHVLPTVLFIDNTLLTKSESIKLRVSCTRPVKSSKRVTIGFYLKDKPEVQLGMNEQSYREVLFA